MKVFIEFEKKPLLFENPRDIIRVRDPNKIAQAFAEIERYLDEGRHIAGFLSYEAGYSFEKKLFVDKKYDFPLLCFGVYGEPKKQRPERPRATEQKLDDVRINISKERYSGNIDQIRHHIECGDVYQITYCIKKKFTFSGDAWGLYNSLLDIQPVPYPAYIETDGMKILSLSPERFLLKKGENILTEPMKGTWWRGGNFISDMIERCRFSRDRKNRAENIMIADLLRNDLGRVGKDIRAPKLYRITKYRTLYQMTSIVTGKVPKDIRCYDLFAALFPSGSVTGAPKIRAMEIIKEIEKEERMIYTGAIGYITPERDMYFNIPIRTALLRGEEGEMGIGGGIVWDSTAEGEWREGMLKAKFLADLVI
jgi:para-aminobenzoate synthetase/4-amino-4-deoxychorismate lyase